MSKARSLRPNHPDVPRKSKVKPAQRTGNSSEIAPKSHARQSENSEKIAQESRGDCSGGIRQALKMAIGLPPRPAAHRGPPGRDRRSLPTVDRYRKLRRNCYVITPVRFSRQNNSSAGITRTLETVGTALAQKVSECVRMCRRYQSDSPNLRKFPDCGNGIAKRSLPPPPAPPNVYPRQQKRRIALNFAPTATRSQKNVYRGEDNNHTSRGQLSASPSVSRTQLPPHLFPRFSTDPPKFP